MSSFQRSADNKEVLEDLKAIVDKVNQLNTLLKESSPDASKIVTVFNDASDIYNSSNLRFDDLDLSFNVAYVNRDGKKKIESIYDIVRDNASADAAVVGEIKKEIEDHEEKKKALDYGDLLECDRFLVLQKGESPSYEKIKSEFPKCFQAISNQSDDYSNYISDYAAKVDGIVKSISTYISDLKTQADNNKKKTQENRIKLRELQERDAVESKNVIDQSAIRVITNTLIAWAGIITLVVGAIIALAWFKYRYQKTADNSEGDGEFSYILFLEIMTVFLLTGAILILGLAAKIDNQGLAALIGGISGYVLGRMRSGSEIKASSSPQSGSSATTAQPVAKPS